MSRSLPLCKHNYTRLVMTIFKTKQINFRETTSINSSKTKKDFFLWAVLSNLEFEKREHDRNSVLKHTSMSHAKSLKELKFSQSHCSGFSCDWLTSHEPKPHSSYQLPLLTKAYVCVFVCE